MRQRGRGTDRNSHLISSCERRCHVKLHKRQKQNLIRQISKKDTLIEICQAETEGLTFSKVSLGSTESLKDRICNVVVFGTTSRQSVSCCQPQNGRSMSPLSHLFHSNCINRTDHVKPFKKLSLILLLEIPEMNTLL